MTTIPNELKITLNTNIPGFQKISYNPNMTIPNLSNNDSSVQFNPLVKLNQNTINNIPESLRKKQFLNKGLFQSLIIAAGVKPAKSLLYATNKGYIDNNIIITLDTLFPDNTIIYINKKPYVITDVQWSKGDWTLGNKLKPNTSPNPKVITGGYNPRQYPPQYPSQYPQYPPQYPQYPQQYPQQYPPQYPPQYPYPTPYNRNLYNRYGFIQPPKNKVTKDNSANSYHITIDMELYPGTKLPPEELSNLNCGNKWNAVKKAYSDFTGKPYVMRPLYKTPIKTNQNKINQNQNQNKTKRRANVNNKTKRNYYPSYNPSYNTRYNVNNKTRKNYNRNY